MQLNNTTIASAGRSYDTFGRIASISNGIDTLSLAAWKKISEIVVKKKMLDPDKRFVEKIIIPELQKQIAIIGETPGKTFTLTFENVLSDEIKVDSKLIDRLKNQGYFSKMFVNKK